MPKARSTAQSPAGSVMFITGHALGASRKASITFMADAMAEMGLKVSMLTLANPIKTNLTHTSLFQGLPFNRWYPAPNKAPNLQGYIWRGIAVPFNLRHPLLDIFTTPLFKLLPSTMPRAVRQRVAGADVIIIESGAGLMLVPLIRQLNPRASLVYSVSDRLSTLRVHPLVRRAEAAAESAFALIRVPAQAMCADFSSKSPVEYIPHGLDKVLFDQKHPNPYTTPRNAVSVGDMLFDATAITTLAEAFADWTFHLFGRGARIPQPLSNVVLHGEVPFKTLVPYLQHANIGIAPYADAPMSDYLSQSSLKLIQYTYCNLPIVAPQFAAAGRTNICAYTPGNAKSLTTAFTQAIKFPRRKITTPVLTWAEVSNHILKAIGRA